ncbi:MAG: hypothetical protein CTY37_02575 [Methylotenera sp.]|nr:MAG: hypothetical protein CTY37_02575 [Methylotenera sp.]
MNSAEIMPANYHETGVTRFKNNPFIEALPPLENSKSDYLVGLSNYPPIPTDKTRISSEIVRMMELSTLNDVVIPFPEYQKAAISLTTIMRDTYVARNPLTVQDRQRRHALASKGSDGLPFPANWKSSAKGHFMMAVSGMGKTTFAQAFLLRYPQVISHTSYQGQTLKCSQVVYVFLRVPHDATLKSLCIQFFSEIDRLLNTNYVRQARSVRQIGLMVQLMNEVATAVSLGFLIVDELQNLKSARGGTAEYVLNLFSEIIERLGISLLVLATPAVQTVIEGSVRNSRKLASYGETVLKPMLKNDPQWENFCDVYWDYSFVKNKGSLTKEIRNVWHKVSAGNTAFAALSFTLAQRNEIGGREVIDVASFERTAATDMAFLQPAIMALLSGRPDKLRAFDDLIFSEKYRSLRKLLGAKDDVEKQNAYEEFDDVIIEDKSPIKKLLRNNSFTQESTLFHERDLPMQDPFQM